MQYFSGAGTGHIVFVDKDNLFGALVTRHFAFAAIDDILLVQIAVIKPSYNFV